jgi:hypothetical protein
MDSSQAGIKPTIGKNALGCVAVIVTAVLVLLFLLLFVIAKSGLVRLPFFSSFYHGPQPTRVVTAQPLTQSQLESAVRAELASQVAASAPPPYRARITEEQLTGALQDALPTALRGGGWKVDRTQAVVTPQGLELLTDLERGSLHADLRIQLVPRLSSTGVSFTPTFVQVGDIPLTPRLAYPVVSAVFSRDLGTWSVSFGSLKLQSIELRDGELDLLVGSP